MKKRIKKKCKKINLFFKKTFESLFFDLSDMINSNI